MSGDAGAIVACLGALGLVEFGGLWLVVSCLGGDVVARRIRGSGLCRARRGRIERWIRIAPALAAVSASLVIAGAILAWATGA